MNAYLDGRVEPARRLSRFLVFGVVVVLAITTLTARLFYLQIVNGGEYTALSTAQRTVVESIPSPRGLIYDRKGRALVSNVPTFAVKIRPSDLPVQFRPEVVERLGAIIGDGPGRDQHDHRQQSRLGLRPRPDRRRRRRGHRPPDLGVVDPAPGRRDRRRGPPRVHRRAADVADHRLHGPRLRRAAPRPQGEGLPARTISSARPASSSSTSSTCAASTAPRASSATPAARRPRSSRRSPTSARATRSASRSTRRPRRRPRRPSSGGSRRSATSAASSSR